MRNFPELDIPDFYSLSKKSWWNPRLYQPILYNEKIKNLSEKLKPGTLDYDDFWDEMDYYCYNGYSPGKMPKISGRHFYYLNFNKIELLRPGWKRKRLSNPFYRDLDHYLFLELEGALKYGYGLIIGKPRRVGLSEWGALNGNYEHTFYERNKIGVCAGKDDKVSEFRQKLESSLNNVHSSYRNGQITNNSDELLLGYTDNINKQKIPMGIQSLSRYKTMYADSSAFEGGSYSLVVFEEIGLFQNLLASYAATKPCFMEGNKQFGLPLLYGTGGEVDGGAYGFKEMWDNCDVYNLKRIFIPAYYYYPGDGFADEKGRIISFFDYERGVTDRKAAKKFIEAERLIAQKSKDTYIKHVQSFPLHPKEMFLKSKGGILDPIRLNFQLKRINNAENPEPVLKGRLDWIDSESTIRLLSRAKNTKEKTKIRVENKSKLKFVEDETGTVWIASNPINKHCSHLSYKPDIGGGDSYDDSANTEKNKKASSGAVVIYRCYSGPTREYNFPAALLLERGDGSYDDDTFYENAVKLAVYYDSEILFEHTKTHIIKYFYDVNAGHLLAGKPDLDVTNNHVNKVGVQMPGPVKEAGIKELKADVKENIHKYWIGEIILDMIDFGDKNTDITMALLVALLHRMGLFGEISDGIELGGNDAINNLIPQEYYVDMHGNLRINTFGEKNNLDIFIPERDMGAREYEEYLNDIRKKGEEEKRKIDNFDADAKKKNLQVSLLSLIEEEREKFRKINR